MFPNALIDYIFRVALLIILSQHALVGPKLLKNNTRHRGITIFMISIASYLVVFVDGNRINTVSYLSFTVSILVLTCNLFDDLKFIKKSYSDIVKKHHLSVVFCSSLLILARSSGSVFNGLTVTILLIFHDHISKMSFNIFMISIASYLVIFVDGNRITTVSYLSFTVSMSVLTCILFDSLKLIKKSDSDIVKKHHLSVVFYSNLVILARSSGGVFNGLTVAILLILRDHISKISFKLFESIESITKRKFIKSVIILPLLFVTLQTLCFILLDLVSSRLLTIIDDNICDLRLKQIAIDFGLDIKHCDIKKIILFWQIVHSRKRYVKLLLSLKNSNKFIDRIICLGTSGFKHWSRAFTTMTARQINNKSRVKKEIDPELIKKLCNKDEAHKIPIVDLVDLSNSIDDSNEVILKRSYNIFRDSNSSINDRLYVSNAMVKQLSSNPDFLTKPVIDEFKAIAIKKQDKFDAKEILINSIALQSLKSVQKDLPYYFYERYYFTNIDPHLREGELSPAKSADLAELKNRVTSEKIKSEEIFLLLETISVLLYNNYTIETSIFTNFNHNDWPRELLVYVLLGNSMKVDDEDWSETRVKEFMQEMHLLFEFIEKNWKKESVKKNEDVLKSLINKQHQYKFNLKQVINILVVARAEPTQIDIILENDDDFIEELVNMEYVWLKTACVNNSIDLTENNCDQDTMNKLHRLLATCDVSAVNKVLDKVKRNSKISDLVSFFELLDHSQLSEHNKRLFLTKLQGTSISKWKENLCKLIVKLLITSEFPDHSDVVSDDVTAIRNEGVMSKFKNVFKSIFQNSNPATQTKFIDFSDEDKTYLNDQLKSKTDKIYNVLSALLKQVEIKMSRLLSLEQWSVSRLALYIHSLDSLEKIDELDKALDIIADYNLKEAQDLNDVIENSYITELEANVLQYAIEKCFSGTYDKNDGELLDELNNLNENYNIGFLKELSAKFREVNVASNGISNLIHSKKLIKDWKDDEIDQWVQNFHISTVSNSIVNNIVLSNITQSEKIAVIKRALELTSKTKIEIRSIQLMSVLLLLNPEQGKGRLAQINTGEGKTNIIAMVAAYHGLHKHKVDIVTTSPVLALPQCRNLNPFYSKLRMTVDHNFNNPDGYKSDIVYGPILDFEADVLRDESINACDRRRRGREYDIVIVDEVDSMFIDGNDHIVMLSSNMPGMNHLEPLLAAIVMQIDSVSSCVKIINGVPHYTLAKSRINSDGTVNTLEEVDFTPLECTKKKFIHDATEKHIRKLVRDEEADPNYPQINIPNHLKEFVTKVQIPKWIDSAILAKHVYENKKHYVIRNGKVMPVDAQNTGVVHENQNWSNGIHQFLQFKHGAKLHPENLVNNYISNVGFFKRFSNRIYGLTGTLGDKRSSEFLEKIYKVDTVIIPPFRKKQHVELVPTISDSKDEWYTAIVKSCLAKLNCGRAVLLITKYIKEIDGDTNEKGLHQKFLDLKYDASKIIIVRTGDDVHLVDRIIEPGEVILTTNVAGRGTDIRLNPAVNEKGGLHVCLTFLPINIRVENQNTGRTSRTGNRGTSQLMLHSEATNIASLRYERDRKHDIKISQAEKDIEVVYTKEKVFTEYLSLVKEIKGRGKLMKFTENQAVNERFGLWLKINEIYIKEKSQDDVMNIFRKFKDEILSADRSDELIQNPYFYVKIGNIYMKNDEHKLAIEEFSKAIKLDQNFAENAYYNRGFCLLAAYGGNMSGNRYYIDDAIGDFKKARKLLQKREEDLHLLQRASDEEAFSEQIQHKINLYNVQKQAIDSAIGTDKDAIDDQLKTLWNRLSSKPAKEERDEIEELIKSLEEDRKRNGVISEARDKGTDIETKLLKLSECLPENEMDNYKEEIEEYEMNGYIGGFQVTEIKPIDWKSVFGLMVLGLGQLIAGAALAVYTLGSGASLAMSLISEGISDIITAVKDGIINRDFSWASWAVQKAISLTIAVVCAGMAAIKDVASTCSSGAAKLVGGKVIDETVKSGWKLVAKTVVKELAKGVVREVVTDLANYGIEQTLMVEIQQKLLEAVEPPIREAVMKNEHIEAMLRMDIHNKNTTYENFIKAEAFKILDTSCKSQILNIAKQIGVGIGDGKIKYFSTVRKITEATLALNELRTLVLDFLSKLESRVEEKVKSDSLVKKLKKIETVSDDTKQNQDSTEKQSNSQTTATEISDDSDQEDIDLKTGPEEKVKVVKPKTDPSRLSKVVISGVSNKMMNTIKGKLVNPVVQTGVNYSMNKITANLDATLNHDVENYKSLRRVINHQDKGYDKPKQEKLVNTNTEQYDDKDPAIKKAKEVIAASEKGGKSGLQDMGGISDQVGRPIEVYDEKGRLKFTIGEKKGGAPIKVQHHKDQEHYTMLGGKDAKKSGKGDNMCLYNVISEQTGTDPDELKAKNLKWMKTNLKEFSKQSSDIARLQAYDGLKLCMGGAKYDKTKGASYYLDNISQGKIAARKPNAKGNVKDGPPGHPRGHASNPNAKEDNASVESYSAKDKLKTDKHDPDKKNVKTGFDSYETQDYAFELAMSHPETAKKIDLLNQGSYREELTLTKEQLQLQDERFKGGGKWVNGVKEDSWNIEDVRLVLDHQKGKYGDPEAPVFVTTFFPIEVEKKQPVPKPIPQAEAEVMTEKVETKKKAKSKKMQTN